MDMDDRRDDDVHTYGPVLFRDEKTDAPHGGMRVM